MSLTTRANSIIIFGATLLSGIWTAVDETPSRTSDGWDSLSITYYKRSETDETIETASGHFLIGQQLGARTFWISDFDGPHCVVPGLWKVVVKYRGWAATKPYVIQYGGTANQQSGENVIINGTIYPKVSTHENGVTASVRYLLLDVSGAPTDQAGKAKNPPTGTAPAVAASGWSFITNPTYHYPNGWVLMSCNVDRLPGTSVGLATDNYQYIHPYSP